jgi:Helix-turn-helix domain
MTWAIAQTPPDAESKLILLLLANYAGDENSCWPSVPRLARESLLSERTVRRRLHDLEQEGFLEITPRTDHNGDSTSNLYSLSCQGVVSGSQGGGARLTPPGGARQTGEPVSTEPVIEPCTQNENTFDQAMARVPLLLREQIGRHTDFARVVFEAWDSVDGKNGAGVLCRFEKLLKKRWSEEGEAWRNGCHPKQKQAPKNSNPTTYFRG